MIHFAFRGARGQNEFVGLNTKNGVKLRLVTTIFISVPTLLLVAHTVTVFGSAGSVFRFRLERTLLSAS